jgi:hypothetical protein
MTDHHQPGISEHEIEALTTEDKRWNWVLKQLGALNLRQSNQDIELANVKESVAENTSITRQIAEDTKAMREAWNDGAAIKRLFCRLAQAWEFMLKKVMVPGLITAAMYIVFRAIFWHDAVPTWFSAAVKLLGW